MLANSKERFAWVALQSVTDEKSKYCLRGGGGGGGGGTHNILGGVCRPVLKPSPYFCEILTSTSPAAS